MTDMFTGLYPGEILFKVSNPHGAQIFDRDGSSPLSVQPIPYGLQIGGTPRGDGYLVEVAQKPYVGWVHALDLQQLGSAAPSPVLASGDFEDDYVGNGSGMMPAYGCPAGTYWSEYYKQCVQNIPSPPPAVGLDAELGCDDCDHVVSGDPCAGNEAATVASAFLNPIGAIFGAANTKKCKDHRDRRRFEERRRRDFHPHHDRHDHHRVGWDGEWDPWRWQRHRRRPWWDQQQFYVGATPSGDPVKAPAHPAVQDATAQATAHPAVHAATARAAQAHGASDVHVSDVSQAATHAVGATAAAETATHAAQTAVHPGPALSAATSARAAATEGRQASQSASHPAAPGTQAAQAARASAAHASRAASHAHAASEARDRSEADRHNRAADTHRRAAEAHARMAHGEVRRGIDERRGMSRGARGGQRDWWSRPEFRGYEQKYGARWWERPEFSDFAWRYGGEWWRRPEFAQYERIYGANWWLKPEFASYAQYYSQQDQGAPAPAPPQPQDDGGDGGDDGGDQSQGQGQGQGQGGSQTCILPGTNGTCLKVMVQQPDGNVFFQVTDDGNAQGVQLDPEEQAHNDALQGGAGQQQPSGGHGGHGGHGGQASSQGSDDGSGGADDGSDDTSTQGDFAGWQELFTDPYGRFDPRLPPAWNSAYMYYPDYYYGMSPRVGIQSGPAIVGWGRNRFQPGRGRGGRGFPHPHHPHYPPPPPPDPGYVPGRVTAGWGRGRGGW
jgi:hypothetical protein